MVFSLGNIITLVIVILILAIYRQMDRNNRSLEKIRRYTDKITGELDRYVDDKTVALKNLAVELDVHQKTGREILKRITGAEENLESRAEGIQRIADRISEYDTAVGNLMTLTTKVDENMKRLQEESAFVDSTGKRLKEVQGRLDTLEKRIPGIVDDFQIINSRELEALRADALEETERRADELDGNIRTAAGEVEEFVRRLDDIDARWEEMDARTLARVEQGHDEILEATRREGEELKAAFETGLKESIKKLYAYQEKLRQEGESLEETLNARMASMEEKSRGWESALSENLAGADRKIEDLKAAFTRDLEEISRKGLDIEASISAGLEETALKGRALSDEIFGDLKIYITGQARGMEKDMQRLFEEERARMTQSARNVEAELEKLNGELEKWRTDGNDRIMLESQRLNQRFDQESDQLQTRFGDMSQAVEMRMSEVEGSVEAEQQHRRDELASFVEATREEISALKNLSQNSLNKLEEQAARGLQELEKQIGNYEEEINYRISRVEQVGDEITTLDENLRHSIDRMVAGVKEEFGSAREELLQMIEKENGEVLVRVDGVKQHMGALEKDLEELKAKAYANVAEQLQVFEDDFFKDLRDREETIRKQFTEWQEGLQRDLAQMSEDHAGEREMAAKELADQLRDRLTQLQTRTFQQYEKYEDQVTSYQERINERIGLSERSLDGLEENLKRQIQDIRQNSRLEFEKLFTEHQTSLEGTLKRWEREWELGVKEQEEKMAQGFRDLNSGMDAARSDVTVWQTQAQQRLKEITADVEERYSLLKSDADSTVEGINKDFVEQRDAFDSFYLDLQKRSKDLEMAIEQKLRDFRAASSEIKEKVESVQQRLFGKIEEHHNTLSVNIQEIDKQQKNFIAQTKIFDRADSLKMALQENIEDLKVEIARITAESREVKEAEKKFITIKKMNEEVSSKLARFLTEKRRIEEMEGDFKKLINLSQSIDIKLDQVTTTHDSLQEVQIRIRALEELEAEVMQKYERLEKKGSVLESTTEDVDRNFQRLRDLEDGLKGIEGSISSLAPQVSEVSSQVKLLAKERGKTSEAIKLISSLDGMLNDIEERTERMQKAREWLAQTETRLEEVNREAQEQVKLLGSLVKEGGLAKQGKGSPMGARDVVTKLARQGWTVEEISRTTKLSRGEVELILELRK